MQQCCITAHTSACGVTWRHCVWSYQDLLNLIKCLAKRRCTNFVAKNCCAATMSAMTSGQNTAGRNMAQKFSGRSLLLFADFDLSNCQGGGGVGSWLGIVWHPPTPKRSKAVHGRNPPLFFWQLKHWLLRMIRPLYIMARRTSWSYCFTRGYLAKRRTTVSSHYLVLIV